MLKAYKLDKYFNKIIKSKYEDASNKLVLVNKIFSYLIGLAIILLPIVSISNDIQSSINISSWAVLVWTLLFILITYKSYFTNSLDYRNKLRIIDEYGSSFLAWSFYKLFKVSIFTLGITTLLYVGDLLGIINVYTKSDNYEVYYTSLFIITILLYVNILYVILTSTKNWFLPVLLITGILFGFGFEFLFNFGDYTGDYICIGSCEENLINIHVSNFKLISNSTVYRTITAIVLVVINYIVLKLTRRSLRGRVYGC